MKSKKLFVLARQIGKSGTVTAAIQGKKPRFVSVKVENTSMKPFTWRAHNGEIWCACDNVFGVHVEGEEGCIYEN